MFGWFPRYGVLKIRRNMDYLILTISREGSYSDFGIFHLFFCMAVSTADVDGEI